MNELDPLVKEFVVESAESLDHLDRELVTLEEDPHDGERLGTVFRAIHNIKGTCGFLGFAKLEAVSHAGESLLCRLRNGRLVWNAEITSTLLTLIDAIREILNNIETTGREGNRDYTALIAQLTGFPEATSLSLSQGNGDVRNGHGKSADIHEAAAATSLVAPSEPHGSGLLEASIRVGIGLLDRLMNLVGELVLARNQILQCSLLQKDPAFLNMSQRLNLITTELQEGVMKTRMQPISNIWNKFPRLTHDLARACGKQVRLVVEGKETELDRSIIEAIKDPLTHLVRNAIDHGIEEPEVRRDRGKPAEGLLSLRAFHEGGLVNIEVADDGAGMDSERIKQKAVERALITRQQAGLLSERELLHLIFVPGFSTADRVTKVSGRGIGMDVVKINIEKINGTIDVQSQPGRGTTVRLKIPLTLAIIPALVVTSGGDRYAIPQVNVLELVRLEAEQARRSIEWIHAAPVYRLRGRLLPLIYLHRELGITESAEIPNDDPVSIVVLQADERPFGLVAEAVNDTEEIMVKPLSKQLQGIPLFAGTTIMGDGRVALILDVLGMAQRAHLVTEARDRAPTGRAVPTADQKDSRQTMVLVGVGKERRLAVPLAQVDRLEEIPQAAVEQAGNREVVQYRGRILPLFRLACILAGDHEPVAQSDPLQVLVYAGQGFQAGLVVDRIFDVVETQAEVQGWSQQVGIAGTALIQQRVTDLLDVPGILQAFDPACVAGPAMIPAEV